MNSTEPRKIIKFGNSSFVISLPLSWIKENNLGKGDLIYLEKNSSNELVIRPINGNNQPEEERKLTINIDGRDIDTLRREINSAYINGYDLITLKGKTLKSKIKPIKKIIEFLIGLSIVGGVDGELVLKDVLSYEKVPPTDLISRINVTIRTMLNHLNGALETKNFVKEYNEIRDLDVEINRNYILIWKLLKKSTLNNSNNTDQASLYNLWWLAMNQEYIGDELKRIARALTKTKFNDKEYQKVFKIVEATEKSYMEAFSVFNGGDRELALSLAKKHLVKDCEIIFKGSNNPLLEGLCDRFRTISRHIHYITKISIY